ncbi:MAG: PAS domain S-box protein [Candidatus Thorarchaeota archaeon]
MKTRILIIDDDDDLIYMAQQYLISLNPDFELVPVSTAQEALRILDEGGLDAVICDFFLGPNQMNGLEILEWLREQGSKTPFIIFTGRSREEIAIQALNLGADYYLEKGSDLGGLFAEIGHHIRSVVRSRKTEEALAKSEARFRALYEGAGAAIAITKEDSSILDVNPAFASLIGYTRDELRRMKVHDFSHAEDHQKDLELFRSTSKSGDDTYSMLKRYIRKDGTQIWGNLTVSIVRDEDEVVSFMFAMVQDVTEEVAATEALRESEEKFRSVFEDSAIANNLYDSDGVLTAANDVCLEMFGVSRIEDYLGLNLFEDPNLPEDVRNRVLSGETVRFLSSFDFEVVKKQSLLSTAKSGIIHIDTVVAPFGMADVGSVLGYFVQMQDVTERVLSLKILAESEERFHRVFDESPIGIEIIDKDGLVIGVNQATLEIFGILDQNEIIGFCIFDDPNTLQEVKEGMRRREVLRFESSFDFGVVRRRGFYSTVKNGVMHIDALITPLGDGDDFQGYMFQIQDITERVRADRAVKESEARYRTIFDHAVDGIHVVDMEGMTQSANDKLCEMMGVTHDEMMTMAVPDFVPEEARQYTLGKFNRVISGEIDQVEELLMRRSDGTLFHADIKTTSVSLDGEPHILGFIRDVTGRKDAEKSLRESESRFRAIFEHAGIGMALVDLDSYVLDANVALTEFIGYTREELIGMRVPRFSHPDDEELDSKSLQELIGKGLNRYQMEKRYIRKDGEEVLGSLTVSLVRDPSGKPQFAIGMAEDITSRKRVEEELRRSEEKYRNLVDNLMSVVVELDADGMFTYVSPRVTDVFGYSPQEVIGKSGFDLIHPDDQESSVLAMTTVAEEGHIRGFEYRIMHKDGHFLEVSASGRLVVEEDEVRYVGVVEDISDKKAAEKQLKASEERYRTLFESSPTAMAITDFDGQLIAANEYMLQMTGYEWDELKLVHASTLYRNASDREPTISDLKMQGNLRDHEIELRRRDGTHFNALLNENLIELDGRISILATIRDITESKNAQQTIIESQEDLQTLFDTIDDFLFVVGLDSNIVQTNLAVRERLGYSSEELIGTSAVMMHPPEQREEAARILADMIAGLTTHCPVPLMRKDGSLIPVETRITLGKWGGKDVLIGVSRDISESIKTEDELRKKTEDLGERVKELTCLYRSSSLLTNTPENVEDVIRALVDILPPAWQCPEVTSARITMKGREFHSENFTESGWRLNAGIVVSGDRIGEIDLFYSEERPQKDEGPFLREERELIDTLAREVGRFIERRDSERALQDSENRFRQFFENAPMYCYMTSSDGTILDVNHAALETLGYDKEQLVGNHVEVLYKLKERPKMKQLLRKWKETGQIRDVQTTIVTKNGEERIVLLSVEAVRDPSGRVLHSVSVQNDITRRIAAEKALVESEERYRTLIESIPVVTWTSDIRGRTLYISPNIEEVYGYSQEEIYSSGEDLWLGRIHPDDVDSVRERYRSLFETGAEFDIEYRIQRSDGDWIWLRDRSTGTYEKNDSILASGAFIDVTDKKRAEEAVIEEKEWAEKYLDTVGSVVVTLDRDGVVGLVNGRGCEVLGRGPEDIIGKDWFETFIPERLRAEMKEVHGRIISADTKGLDTYENPVLNSSGEEVTIVWRNVSLLDGSGNVIGSLSSGIDITGRKEVEEELRRDRDFLEGVMESLTHPFYVIDAKDYTIRMANEAARLGPLSESSTCYSLTHRRPAPCNGSDHPCPLEEVKRSKKPVVVEHQHYDEDNNIREIEVHGYPILDLEGNVVQMIEYGLDITELKTTLRAFEESEKRFRQLYENAPLSYQTLDEDGKIAAVNPAWLGSLGYSEEEVVGRHFGEFLTPSSERTFVERFPMFIAEGTASNVEYEMIRRDGTCLTARFSGKAVFDERGDFQQTHCIFQDVTEWKIADRRLRRQKEELSELAHVMSHDLGNKMRNIRSMIALMRKEHSEEILERIDKLAHQADELLQSSAELADAGLIIEEFEIVKFDSIVREIAGTLIPTGKSFHQDRLPDVLGDPDRLGQIFENLFSNAIEHGRPSSIEVRRIDSRAGIDILIANDGECISEELREKIFLRGFTTKDGGKGLGLAIVRKLVEAHGWTIQIESDERTVFRIEIPRGSIPI